MLLHRTGGDPPVACPRTYHIMDLSKKQFLPQGIVDTTASLTLPTKPFKEKKSKSSDIEQSKNIQEWAGLPLQAGESIPTQYEWWPWKINGISLMPLEASKWLSELPLSSDNSDVIITDNKVRFMNNLSEEFNL